MTLFSRTWFLFLWLAVHGAAFAQLHEVGDGSDGPVKAAHVTAELAASVASVSRRGVHLSGAANRPRPGPARIADAVRRAQRSLSASELTLLSRSCIPCLLTLS